MRLDQFDKLQLRLEFYGLPREKAIEIAGTCRTAANMMASNESQREQFAISVAQAFASGVLPADELRRLREIAPIVELEVDPPGVQIKPSAKLEFERTYGFAARRAGSSISGLIRAVVEDMKRLSK